MALPEIVGSVSSQTTGTHGQVRLDADRNVIKCFSDGTEAKKNGGPYETFSLLWMHFLNVHPTGGGRKHAVGVHTDRDHIPKKT